MERNHYMEREDDTVQGVLDAAQRAGIDTESELHALLEEHGIQFGSQTEARIMDDLGLVSEIDFATPERADNDFGDISGAAEEYTRSLADDDDPFGGF